MKTIYTECVVSLAQGHAPSTIDDAVILRIEDDGAGPFLVIRGRVESLGDGPFALNPEEIDQFAGICKAFLAQAE